MPLRPRLTFATAGMLALGAAALLLWFKGSPPRELPLPTPNGYEELLQAAEEAVEGPTQPGDILSETGLQRIVHQSQTALALARSGCTRPCRAVISHPPQGLSYSLQHRATLRQFKAIAWAFRAESELARRRGRMAEAARISVDGIRFGQELCRGGLILDRVAGAACETLALGGLTNLVDKLDGSTCRELAQRLQSLDTGREPWKETLKADRRYFRRYSTLSEDLSILVYQLGQWVQSWWWPIPNPRQHVERVQELERRLILHLAARAFELESGRAARSAAELTPEYLPRIPTDPRTGRNLPWP